jgi:hypothetical protein
MSHKRNALKKAARFNRRSLERAAKHSRKMKPPQWVPFELRSVNVTVATEFTKDQQA